jgi:hypothetical protein
MSDRWTIRGVDAEAIDMVGEVAEASGDSYGTLVTEAIVAWYQSLPEADDDIESAIQALVGPCETITNGSIDSTPELCRTS